MLLNKKPVLCLDDMRDTSCRNPAFVRAAVMAVLEQSGLAPSDPGSEFRGMRLTEIADRCARAADIPRTAAAAHLLQVQALYTTSDWPAILNGIAQSAVLAGWDAGPFAWQRYCGTVDLRSFRPQDRVYVGGFGLFAKIPEGEAIPAVTIPGYTSSSSADSYGIGFGVTAEALINNDIQALIDRARAVGHAAAATIESVSCSVLKANPVLRDGGTLFNGTAIDGNGGHANKALVDAGISSTAIALGKSAMRRQSAEKDGRALNIRPRFVLASAEQEEEAWAVVGLPGGFGEAGSDLERYLLQSGRCELLTTPYLQDNAWFLAADPLVAPLVNIAFLNGQREPSLSSRFNFRSGGFECVARLDFGAAAGDWRGGYMNAGSES